MLSKQEIQEKYVERQRSYQLCFTTGDAEKMIEDLKEFCRAETSTFHSDARIHAVLEGRREVWLRIQEFLNLNINDLLSKRIVEVSNKERTK